MRSHWLDDEVCELPNGAFVEGFSVGVKFAVDGYWGFGFLFYPCFGLVVVCVDKDEFVFSSAFYQLVGFNN